MFDSLRNAPTKKSFLMVWVSQVHLEGDPFATLVKHGHVLLGVVIAGELPQDLMASFV